MFKFKFFLKIYFFWLFLFFINRVIFFIFYFKSFKNIKIHEILQIVPNSISLDLSFISYVASIVFLLILLAFYYHPLKLNYLLIRLLIFL